MKKPTRIRNGILLGAGVALALIIGVVLKPTPVQVAYVSADRGDVERIVEEKMTVRTHKVWSVEALEPGTVVKLPVSVGSYVKPKEILVVIDASKAENELEAAKAQVKSLAASYREVVKPVDQNRLAIAEEAVKSAEIALEKAKDEATRITSLYQADAASKSELDEAVRNVASAQSNVATQKSAFALVIQSVSNNVRTQKKADVESAQASVEILKTAIQNHVLKAPAKGVVTAMSVNEGDYVFAGDRIMTLADPSQLYVTADVLDTDIRDIALNMPVVIENPEGRLIQGSVVKIHPQLMEKTSDLGIIQKRVRVEIALVGDLSLQKTKGLLLEQELDGHFVSQVHQNVVRVNRDFVYEDKTGHFVLVNQGGKLTRRAVEIGIEGKELVEIKKGLSSGEKIVSEMDEKLEEGAAIK